MPNISVDLSNNFITKFTNVIRWNSTCQTAVSPNRQTKMHLYLRDNRIDHIVTLVKDLNFNSMIDVLCWMQEVHLYMRHCPYVCDCLDYTLHALDNIGNLADILQDVCCLNRDSFLSVRARYVPLEELVCRVQELCPGGCICVNQPSNSTFHVTCTNNGLNGLPSSVPNTTLPTSLFMPTRKKFYKLSFAYNNISYLEPRDYFVDTVYLDLSH